MKLLFGLGNPEEKYSGTRHNVGFFAVDSIAKEHSTQLQLKTKFKALLAEVGQGDEKLIIAKPLTYYNNVGESMRAIADFYNLTPEDILIMADDLALPFGTLRTRIGGSDAGNNGIKSINMHGGEQTRRLRIGISNDLRQHVDDVNFVLGKFSKVEQEALAALMPEVSNIIDNFIGNSFETSTYRTR